MAARLKSNRDLKKYPNIEGVYVCCSSGPNDTSLDIERYGGLLICRHYAFHMGKDYVTEKEQAELRKTFESKNPKELIYCKDKEMEIEDMKWI